MGSWLNSSPGEEDWHYCPEIGSLRRGGREGRGGGRERGGERGREGERGRRGGREEGGEREGGKKREMKLNWLLSHKLQFMSAVVCSCVHTLIALDKDCFNEQLSLYAHSPVM